MSEFTPLDAKTGVTVCIANWNGGRWLGDCLRSLRDAEGPTKQVIVVDNASSDDSVNLIRDGFPEVELIINRENAGYGRANNQAILRGRGRYFLILNNDTVLAPGALGILTRFLDEHPSVGMACGRLVNRDGSIQFTYYPVALPSVASMVADLLWLNRLSPRKRLGRGELARHFDPGKPWKMEQIPGACMFVRREALEKVGLFDEGYRFWYEDVDLCARFLRAGWEIWYLPDAKILHQGGAATRLMPISTRSLFRFRSMLRYAQHYFTPGRFLLVRVIAGLVLLIRMPIVVAMSLWPSARVRSLWKETWKVYLQLLGEIVHASNRRAQPSQPRGTQHAGETQNPASQ